MKICIFAGYKIKYKRKQLYENQHLVIYLSVTLGTYCVQSQWYDGGGAWALCQPARFSFARYLYIMPARNVLRDTINWYQAYLYSTLAGGNEIHCSKARSLIAFCTPCTAAHVQNAHIRCPVNVLRQYSSLLVASLNQTLLLT